MVPNKSYSPCGCLASHHQGLNPMDLHNHVASTFSGSGCSLCSPKQSLLLSIFLDSPSTFPSSLDPLSLFSSL